MQPIHWSFLFYGLSSNWNRRKIKLSNIFNQEIIKWWWINWLSSSLCVCLGSATNTVLACVSLFPCFECDVFHLSFAQVEEWSVCCSLAVSYCSLHLGNKLSVCFIIQSCECVCERMSWGFHIHCAFFFLSFELFSMNWINPVGQSEICVCGNCFTQCHAHRIPSIKVAAFCIQGYSFTAGKN